MATAVDLTPEQRAAYALKLRRRIVPDGPTQAKIERRRDAAWRAARSAADMLKERYGATRVVVFGSLARGDFTLGSDIDLAAWDVDPKRYYEAVARILDLGQDVVDPGGGFRIDVLPAEDVFAPLLATIQRDGVEV